MHPPGMPPALKNGVDIQLQSAFADENWATVIRLADKRAKATGDAYYEAIKISAEAQLDGVVDKAAAAVAIDRWVRQNTVPKDVEALDLLAWGCGGTAVRQDYAAALGTLRVRWARTYRSNVPGLLACLRECLLQWDLENAQQITILLDKLPGAHDRRFMFWNILLMHMLATSPEYPPMKRMVYGSLAQKQLQRAAELATTTPLPDRSLHEEEEFLLYYRVVATHGKTADFVALALDADTGALAQLRRGRKQAFTEALTTLEAADQWDAVFALCRDALQMADADGTPATLACDVRIWKAFVASATQQANVEGAFDTVQHVLQTFVAAQATIPRMFAKTVGVALLETVFALPAALVAEDDAAPDATEPSLRVEQLLAYMAAHLDRAALFGDVRGYVECLSFNESRVLLQGVAALAPKENTSAAAAAFVAHRTVLLLQLRYLLATSPQTRWSSPATPLTCKMCRQPAAPHGCATCFRVLAADSLSAHQAVTADAVLAPQLPRLDKDPRVALALVAASSLLQLAGLSHARGDTGRLRLTLADGTRLLQAAALLAYQHRQTPTDNALPLLLVRVHLLLGWAAEALRLWKPLGVKRTILDALGPLLFDRLATVAPVCVHGSPPLTEGLRAYYANVLQRPAPVKIWDGFAAGSYSSILDMARFTADLRHSTTRAMAVVEARRAARALGGYLDDVETLPVFDDLAPTVDLVTVTDDGALPNPSSSSAPALVETLALGPGLHTTRLHLGLLTERLLDLVSHKPPKEYKPLRPAEAARRDLAFVRESLAAVAASFATVLHRPDTPRHLTAAERTHATVLSLLAELAALAVEGLAAPPPPYLADLVAALATMHDVARAGLPSTRKADTPEQNAAATLDLLTNLHTVALFRETAAAMKQTAVFLTALHDRETARDRSGRAGLNKDVLAAVRTLKATAAQAFGDTKALLQAGVDRIAAPGFQNGFNAWVAGAGSDDELSRAVVAVIGGRDALDAWSACLVSGWRTALREWTTVQLE